MHPPSVSTSLALAPSPLDCLAAYKLAAQPDNSDPAVRMPPRPEGFPVAPLPCPMIVPYKDRPDCPVSPPPIANTTPHHSSSHKALDNSSLLRRTPLLFCWD